MYSYVNRLRKQRLFRFSVQFTFTNTPYTFEKSLSNAGFLAMLFFTDKAILDVTETHNSEYKEVLGARTPDH